MNKSKSVKIHKNHGYHGNKCFSWKANFTENITAVNSWIRLIPIYATHNSLLNVRSKPALQVWDEEYSGNWEKWRHRPVMKTMLCEELSNKLSATECKSWSCCQLQRLQTFMNHIARCLATPHASSVIQITSPQATICLCSYHYFCQDKKVAYTRLPSTRFRSWSQSLAVSLQVTLVITQW